MSGFILDEWVCDNCKIKTGSINLIDCYYLCTGCYESRVRVRLAAPDMCRVLLELEWSSPSGSFECPLCQRWSTYEHETTCTLSAALTEAGLPDQTSRDAARKRLNENK